MKSENFVSRILATSKLRGSMETTRTNDVIHGDKRKCLHSPDPFSLYALGGAGPRDYAIKAFVQTLSRFFRRGDWLARLGL